VLAVLASASSAGKCYMLVCIFYSGRWFDGSRKKFVEVGKDASDWFSKYLNKEALLVTTHPDLMSEVNPQLTYSEAARVERHKGTRVRYCRAPHSIYCIYLDLVL